MPQGWSIRKLSCFNVNLSGGYGNRPEPMGHATYPQPLCAILRRKIKVKFIDSMTSVIKKVKDIIGKSNVLLEKDVLTTEEITNYKRMSLDFFYWLLNENYNETINDIANRCIKYEVLRFKNPIIQWIYNQLTEARDWITFKAPYLRKKTDSDYYKTYIFWTVKRLEGITMNLEAINKNEKKKLS